MTQEVLKLALEALDLAQFLLEKSNHHGKILDAYTAIKEALAQTQDPVAWRRREVGGGWQYYGWEETGMEAVNTANKNGFECEAVPATPPQRTWVRLAAEDRLTAKYMQDAPDGIEAVIDYIEAKLKEKNT